MTLNRHKHKYFAALHGVLDAGATQKPGLLTWSLGVFHTNTTNDIINVASAVVPMFGFFQNGAKTLREGVEAKAAYTWDRWTVSANYTFINATYQTNLILQSPNNPANADGFIFVIPGDHIPAIPNQRFKLSAEYQITDAWKFGGDLLVFGSQYLIHDDANQNPKVPPYWFVNAHTTYQVTQNVEVFGLVQNLFDQHYYAAGTFFQTGGFTNVGGGPNLFANLTNPLTYLPSMPLAAYAGLRATF